MYLLHWVERLKWLEVLILPSLIIGSRVPTITDMFSIDGIVYWHLVTLGFIFVIDDFVTIFYIRLKYVFEVVRGFSDHSYLFSFRTRKSGSIFDPQQPEK
jgi:hypothetical protein